MKQLFDAIRKRPVVTIVCVLVIVLLAWGFWPQPILVEAVSVRRAPLTVTIEEEGRTRVVDRYVVSAPVDGVTCRVSLDVGDPVSRGQELLAITPLESQVLDPRSRAQARAAVSAAESALHAAEEKVRTAAAAERLASAELDRFRQLLEKKLISIGNFDKAVSTARAAEAEKRSAEFQVEVARYELDAARMVLDYSAGSAGDSVESVPVRAPITGKILKVQHECEGPVRTGDPLLEVGDPSQLEIEVDVLSADAVKIDSGMKVLFERWGGEGDLEGVVRLVEPVGFTKVSALGVEEQRVLVISDFVSPPEHWRRLGDGYRVEARFILWHAEDVLQVPAGSLFRYGDGWAVFVIEDGRARRREVAVGRRNGLAAQILDGLAADERVIEHPGDDVDEGRRVRPRQAQ